MEFMSQGYFFACAFFAIVGALITVMNRNPIRGAMGLLLTILCIAGLFMALHAQFLAAMNSFAVSSKVNRGKQFMLRAGVEATPTLVINGKYRVTGGRDWEDKLRIADHLIARERAAAGNGG